MPEVKLGQIVTGPEVGERSEKVRPPGRQAVVLGDGDEHGHGLPPAGEGDPPALLGVVYERGKLVAGFGDRVGARNQGSKMYIIIAIDSGSGNSCFEGSEASPGSTAGRQRVPMLHDAW
jgi:hypothetical protein